MANNNNYLFEEKGKKKNVSFLKPYEETETEIQTSICKYLNCVQGIYYWRQNTQGTYDPRNGRWRKSKSPGVSDLLLIHKGKLYCFEIKRNEKSEVRESQILFRENVEKAGAKYYIVWSVNMVQEIVNNIINSNE